VKHPGSKRIVVHLRRIDQRKRRRPEDAEARDGNRYDRNGLVMKRLIPAERRFPRLIDRERGNPPLFPLISKMISILPTN